MIQYILQNPSPVVDALALLLILDHALLDILDTALGL